MKFLCPSCRAKYQIADDKVSGRTLKMACRQCGDDIVIRGDRNQSSRAPAPVAHADQAVSTNYAQHATAGTGAGVAVQEVWHVAIDDVPVGPLHREEVARRIATGIVDRESLAWREGLDDWLPIAQIPELMSLWRSRSRVAPLPVPPPAALAAAEAFDGRSSVAGAASQPPAPAMESGAAMATHDASESQLPRPFPADQEVSVRRFRGWGPKFLLVCGGASILAVGSLLGARIVAPPVADQVAAPAPPAMPPRQAQLDLLDETGPGEEQGGGNLIILDQQEIAGEPEEATKSSRRRPPARRKRPASNRAPADKLTDEQREKLARMGSDFRNPSALKRSRASESDGTDHDQGLKPDQVVKVLTKGKRSLQRCYETALRGAGSSDTVRLDVRITVSPSGNVSRVTTTGKALPGMNKCISSTARTWRFPKSSGTTTTEFPILFQPGA